MLFETFLLTKAEETFGLKKIDLCDRMKTELLNNTDWIFLRKTDKYNMYIDFCKRQDKCAFPMNFSYGLSICIAMCLWSLYLLDRFS